MNIRQEISFAKSAADHAYNTYGEKLKMVRMLKSLGWKEIGRGSFAIVLTHDECPSVVLKVTNIKTRKHHSFVDAWHELVFWMLDEGVRSKFLPKIYDIFGYRHSTDFITVMERLYPLPKGTQAMHMMFDIEMMAIDVHYSKEPFPFKKYGDHRLFYMSKILFRIKESVTFWGFDMHRNNVMRRKCGAIVLADPIISV